MFNYVANDMYRFLSNSLEGRIILGKYKNTKILDHCRLTDMLILNELKDDSINYK